MKLEVLAPTHVAVETPADKIVAEARDGSFCLLPRHVDCVAVLVPSLLLYEADGEESIVAVDGGILVKCGQDVLVSTMRVVRGDLDDLQSAVRTSFTQRNERDRTAHVTLSRLETDILRRFVELSAHART
jgi:F-type H+-transporting ATPase subunit epsilon